MEEYNKFYYRYFIEYDSKINKCKFMKKVHNIIYEDFDNKIPNDYYKLEDVGFFTTEEINIEEAKKMYNEKENYIHIDFQSFLKSGKFSNIDKIYSFIKEYYQNL